MLADVLPYLRCPVCRRQLSAQEAALRCPHGHSFDRARQDYVHLTSTPLTHTGDSPAMVAARETFLAGGHYDFIAAALVEAIPPTAGLIVDVGAGTGYYLAAVLDARPDAVGLAIDASKAALRRAARAHPRVGAVVGDAWRGLPVADRAAAVLINVFAPRNGAEFARLLAPDGVLVVVTPTGDHLGELVSALGLLTVDPAKEDRVAASLAPRFVERGTRVCEKSLLLRRADVAGLIGMGPSAWHVDPGELSARIAPLPEPIAVTARVRLSRYSQVSPEKLDQGLP
jgi:23S rRNA (guanine745-N1)-methyltransferase